MAQVHTITVSNSGFVYLLRHVLIFLLGVKLIQGQCFGGTETYEKTTGVKFTFGASQGILTQPGTGITRDCTAICRQTPTCASFTVDYETSRCQSYNTDSAGHRNSLHEKIGSNYFEKICLRGVSNLSSMCGDRLWAFERVVGAYLEGFDDREERNMQTKTECEKLCLFETSFTCRSAEFDEALNICRLSREDRRSQPNAFRKVPGSSVDYLENQCVRSLPDCRYNVREGSAVISMDELQFAAHQAECEALCDQARGFTCRSFTYAMSEKRCYLSGDDSLSLNNAPLLIKRDAVYAEKQCSISQCEDGLFTFEKVTGHFLRSAQQVGLAMAASPGITLQCGAKCLDAGSDCPAFILDYNAMKCFKLDRNTQGRGSDLSPREGQSYFEKICLRGYIHGCEGRAWAFERRQGKELRGHDDLKLNLVQSRRDCMEACLSEQRFACRSAEYDTLTTECRLSSEDRRTRPTDYVDAPPTTEYLENQCLPQETRCNFKSIPNSYPRYLDLVMSLVSDEMDCKRRCLEYTDFICRSFSYYPSGSQCFISGDDRASAGNEALMSRPGTDYFERNCLYGVTPHGDPQGRCSIGRLEFEKVTGFELQGQRGYSLFRNTIPGISIQCAQLCRSDPRCRGFNLDYNRNDCTGLEGDTDGSRIDIRPVPGMAYFEGICLQGATCTVPWVYERYINRELRGFVNAAFQGISKTECEERCLEERTFICRSITYNYVRKECRMSCEDRYTKPQAFILNGETDYLENQCAPPLTQCVYTYHRSGQQLIYTDKSLSSFSDKSCEQACDVEREFVCRSYTFLGQTGLNTNHCLLSGTLGSTVENSGFQPQSGALYSEKECLSSSALPPVPPVPPVPPGRYPAGSEPGPSLLPFPCRHTLSYEKIAGATFSSSHREPIRTRDDIGIGVECLTKCAQMRQHCLAVSVENIRGGRQRCYALDRSSDSETAPLDSAPDLAYFQKICLREPTCSKAWAFTRVPSYELAAPNALEVRNVYSRRQCQDECLRETRIICRSAIYYGREKMCKLTPETRRTTPQHFRRSTVDVDYMENECAPNPPSCEYTDFPGKFLPYTDRYIPQIYDAPECKHLCNQEKDFNCRSFNYHVVRRDCFLSSDDTFAADRSSLLTDRDFFYSEIGACSNVRVDCTQADMLITFLFGGPFEGRVYATGNPQACFEMGSGQSQLVLRIPMGTQCGTVQQGRGRYVNHVVIQQNPVIMQETDKTVRVECSFDASDQTVSYAPSGNRNQEGSGISVTVPFRPSGTNIVTNTAPAPNVRMRIITHKGQEASVVGLGEELQLKIEIDPNSAFGVFVRNLEARTDNGELLTLIDNVGCPRDPNIFPALQTERGTRDLFADFKAFRFPSTATVNFVATVQFCQDICEPIRCNNGVPSFGRKRREVTDVFSQIDDTEIKTGKCRHQDKLVNSQQPNGKQNVTSNSTDEFESSDSIYCNESVTDIPSSEDVTYKDSEVENDHELNVTEVATVIPAKVQTTMLSAIKPSEPEVPNEVPLQLRLVVGEDSIPNPTKPAIVKKVNARESQVHRTLWEENSNEQINIVRKGAEEDIDSICTTKSTVVVVIITLILFNTSLVFGIMYFYKTRKEQWKRSSLTEPRFTQCQIPEVLFRNVYDRLPPNPTLSTLGHHIGVKK